jgi:hypothetical protein
MIEASFAPQGLFAMKSLTGSVSLGPAYSSTD